MVQTALRGAFQGAGQNCMGAEHFLVQAPIHDAFVSDFLERNHMCLAKPLSVTDFHLLV